MVQLHTGLELSLTIRGAPYVLRLFTLSRDFRFFYGVALTRGQGDQDIIILSRTVDVLIQVTLSRATAIFSSLACPLCPRGSPWAKGWQLNIIMSSSTVVLWLIILSRVVFTFADIAQHPQGLPRFGGERRHSFQHLTKNTLVLFTHTTC